ncbi:Glycosyl hydrolase family 12 [Streptomyces sp. TLI_053]|uniref:ricin-type beta-trefoil lectin domain protein n=1 Tax=Streptomyces sp. TLI_053 TaxID=1855352 RepID=UPI00087ACB8B|nr:ricin-type beta-trefoil lectin domain protein [Streptomyces sp. TLI_053]SDT68960.1 Glycosyl hydrolase family 12 [Streptomyces sp. TLI_053]
MRGIDSARRRVALVGAALLCAVAGSGSFAGTAVAAAGEVCGQNTLTVAGDYEVGPGEWNADRRRVRQCVTTDGGANFTLSTSQLTPDTISNPGLGPGAYAYIKPLRGLPIPVASLGDATSTWHTTQGVAGTYDAAYDLWFSNDATSCDPTTSDELMIWLNGQGPQAKPYGPTDVGTVDIGGTGYRVSAATVSPTHHLINYQLPTATSAVDRLDLRLFAIDAISRGHLPRAQYLCGVSAGFEIWENGTGLATSSFSFEPVTGLPTGTVSSGIPGRCLDDFRSATTDGNPVVLWGCNGTDAQTWTFANDGTLQVLGKCLQPTGTSSGSPIVVGSCAEAAAKWRPGASHSLVNIGTGLCLDDPGSSADWGVQMQLHPCNGTAAQQWRLPYNGVPISGGLTNAAAQECLTGGSAGAPAVLSGCTYDGSQIWTLGNDGTLRALGLCLQPAAGSAVTLATCDGSPAQQWVVHPSGYLNHPADGLCLDGPQGSTAEGPPLRLAGCEPGPSRTWYLPA